MAEHAGENLLRLMARLDLSISQVAERTGLDERTIRGIVHGTNRPQARSLHRLAAGLGCRSTSSSSTPPNCFTGTSTG